MSKKALGIVLPDEWSVARLADISDVRDGTHDSPKYLESGIPFITSKNLKNGKLDFTTCNFISEEDHRKFSERSNVQNGDIIFGMIGTLGSPVIVDTDFEFSIKNVALIKFNNTQLFNQYMKYLLDSTLVQREFERISDGGVQKFISLSTIRSLQIPIPPLKEQQKIAEILSSVDAAIEKTEQVIAKTEEIKKGLMQQLLTKGIGHTEFKQTELGEIPVEWEIKNLVEVAVLTMGQSPSSEDCNEDGQGLVFFQGCSEFGDKYPIPKKYCTNPRKRASKGDILISVRAPVGDLNIAHIECAIGRGLAVIDPINIDRDYLFYYFKLYKDQWQRIQQGSTFSAINKNDLESVLVPCPPKDEQMLIVSKLLTLDKKLEIETEQLDSLQILKKGLMQQLLTGQVRVKVD